MYLNIYIHLPPFAINDYPESSLYHPLERNFCRQILSGFPLWSPRLCHRHVVAMVPPFQWRSSHQGGGSLQQLGTSNATAYAKTRLGLWFSMTLARKWMVFLSPKYMLARPPPFFLVMSLEKWAVLTGQLGVNWGSLSSPNGEFLPQPGVKEESAGSCSIDCPKFMFVYAPARILVGWIFPHFGVTPILPGILPTEIWYFPPKTSSGDQLDWSVGQDTAALSGAELASEMTSNGTSHHWFLADTEVEVS